MDSFNTRQTLTVDGETIHYHALSALPDQAKVASLPFSLKILLENLLRLEDGKNTDKSHIEALLNYDPSKTPSEQIAFTPARVILQDFTGVPAVVDLAAMRDAMANLGQDPNQINPLSPAELVIDHSVMVDVFKDLDAYAKNMSIEFDRNQERYEFLRWGQSAFDNFKVVPPGTGIVHQVNIEYLARVVFTQSLGDNEWMAYPDSLVGTDSHTTMVNALGVLGWGVGGIEAEAAMLGQPVTMLIPQVIGFELTGKLREGATATDLVLTICEMLRAKGVVGKFVEFFGDGLSQMTLADRATISNMAPEFGATCAMFPYDEETLAYLRLTGRDEKQVAIVEAYAKAQGLFRTDDCPVAQYTDVLKLDLQTVVPCIAGPKRPQDRIELDTAQKAFKRDLSLQNNLTPGGANKPVPCEYAGQNFELSHGDVVIAAITSCTNTSNPEVMLAAGLIAKRAHEKGLAPKPWVKTSLAPGSQVVTDYLEKSGLMDDLEAMGFGLVGYGCTTCIGNSGPLPDPIQSAIADHQLHTAAVLSGNRNFEGRIHPNVRFAYLASPPLVVAYALSGTMDFDFETDSLGNDQAGNPVFLKDLWPSQSELRDMMAASIEPEMFRSRYDDVFKGDTRWQSLSITEAERYAWKNDSTYVQNPPYFEGMTSEVPKLESIESARVLVKVGDSVTTDHISPAGVIQADSPAGQYLQAKGIAPKDFNSYGSRRGNHEVMMRGTFANIRLRNQMAPGTEGGWTKHVPTGEITSIFDASMQYQQENTPLIVIAGKEYGTGSSRDWAAKGTRLLGVRAVIAQSFERIHRSNLIGMGVLPLEFKAGEGSDALGLTGEEVFSIDLSSLTVKGSLTVNVSGHPSLSSFEVNVRIDTPQELDYYLHGGILHYVLRQLAA